MEGLDLLAMNDATVSKSGGRPLVETSTEPGVAAKLLNISRRSLDGCGLLILCRGGASLKMWPIDHRFAGREAQKNRRSLTGG
jgi:hypothetical protein